MDIALSHAKNPVLGWDIQVTATAAPEEKIVFARIDVDGFPEFKWEIAPPLDKWHKTLTQQGQYPGDNKVLVTITNDRGEQTTSEDDWE